MAEAANRDESVGRRAAELAARQSYGKLLAFLAARTSDLAEAEDALADAFAAALETWPKSGAPRSPEAWLVTAARRRLLDRGRRRRVRGAAADHLRLVADEAAARCDEPAVVPDDRLLLMFACAHPAIDPGIRAALILQTVLGFDAGAIASSFLVAPATMAQRLARAKRKIRDARIPFRLPEAEDLPERLDAVLDAIYAVFAEGWADLSGGESPRRGYAEEAIWLGRLVATLMPDDPEALGLLALMLHADARRLARRDADRRYVPLAEQDAASWNGAMIAEAERLLLAASGRRRIGRFQLEAAIQSAHAARRRAGTTDWAAIVALYDALLASTGSPVVAINRAAALGELQGAAAGLRALDEIAGDARLADYQPYWAARAGLLARNGDAAAADAAYLRAIGLAADPAIRRFLEERRARR